MQVIGTAISGASITVSTYGWYFFFEKGADAAGYHWLAGFIMGVVGFAMIILSPERG